MSRLRRRSEGDLEYFEHFSDDADIGFLADDGFHDRDKKYKAAWQRVDERRDIRLLREQLEDWEDWDANWPDEGDKAEVSEIR